MIGKLINCHLDGFISIVQWEFRGKLTHLSNFEALRMIAVASTPPLPSTAVARIWAASEPWTETSWEFAFCRDSINVSARALAWETERVLASV